MLMFFEDHGSVRLLFELTEGVWLARVLPADSEQKECREGGRGIVYHRAMRCHDMPWHLIHADVSLSRIALHNVHGSSAVGSGDSLGAGPHRGFFAGNSDVRLLALVVAVLKSVSAELAA